MDEGTALDTLVWVALISVAAPLLDVLLRGRLPQVVLLLVGGIVIGPEVLKLGDPQSIQVLAELGLGFLFLVAGYEVEPAILRDAVTKRALVAWFGSLALALVLVGGLAATGFVHSYVAVSLAMTTTALGVLLPLLREHDLSGGTFGRSVLATGAVGEMLPVLAIAVFLGSRGEVVALVSLAAVGVLALLLSYLPRLINGTWIQRAYRANLDDTAQASVRATVLLLVLFLAVAFDFGLDVVLGAFLAGFVLRLLGPQEGAAALEHKLDVIGYGFFIPIFFISSGMGLDIDSIAHAPQRLVVFFVLLLVVRGIPTIVAFRGVLPRPDLVDLGLLAPTALPLLVAITQIGLDNGTMLPANAAALVGAGAVTLLVLPATALAVRSRRERRETVSADRR
ncbi:cation:proton antiporter [Marmoricola sp. RAF53]|uniref:cation:proton antiporter n=1 Tax=Marmoricola sp. RAF53 TaxID=3233059 RepID=UPI003F998878